MNNNYLLEDCVEWAIEGCVSIVQVSETNKSYLEECQMEKIIFTA